MVDGHKLLEQSRADLLFNGSWFLAFKPLLSNVRLLLRSAVSVVTLSGCILDTFELAELFVLQTVCGIGEWEK